MIVDYHLHTQSSSDGKGSMDDYANKAWEKQITEIGFSDHIDKESLNEQSDFFAGIMSKYVEAFVTAKKKSAVK